MAQRDPAAALAADPATDLAANLTGLAALSLPELRQRWFELTGKPVPRVRATLLRMALAFELQAAIHGGLSRRCQQRLAQIVGARTQTQTAQPGTRLVREWNGVLHSVLIAADGTIQWDGRPWRSLSEVARAITGTRWSGPAFFGLKQKVRAA